MTTNANFRFHIIGAGRGGTSLIGGLVDAHPKFSVMMEEFSIPYLMGRKVTTVENEIDAERRVIGRIDNFLDSCRQKAARSPRMIVCHKTTTEQIRGLASFGVNSYVKDKEEIRYSLDEFDYLGYFARKIADAKVIFVLRDGRTCVRSKVNRTGQTIEEATRRWKYSVLVLRALKDICPDFYLLKLEDLIDHPEKKLDKVCNFLGDTFDSAMLAGTRNPKMKKEYQRAGFDANVTRVGDFDLTALAEMRDELQAFGYL